MYELDKVDIIFYTKIVEKWIKNNYTNNEKLLYSFFKRKTE